MTTFAVTVAAGKFVIDGVSQKALTLAEGTTYTFDQADASNANHPLRLSTTSDGTHGGGSEYTTGVTTNGTPGQAGSYTRIVLAAGAPTLYYYCSNHSGMGGTITTNSTPSNARNIGDSASVINFLDGVTSNVQTQLNTLTTSIGSISVTSGSLTKTFAADETATISLTGNVISPVVAVTKETGQSGVTNNAWDAAASTYTFENSAPATTLNFDPDLAGATDDGFYGQGQDTAPQGVRFNLDGSKMYVLGKSTSALYQYDLTTNFDVSTAGYASKSLSLSGQISWEAAFSFNADGTSVYVLDYGGTRTIYQYTLSTAFDLSTGSYASKSFSVNSQDTQPYSLEFNPTGSKMFVLGLDNASVFSYTLSTAFDVSTASYDSASFSVGSQNTVPVGILFNTAGTIMYMVGMTVPASIFKYSLSTAFDISTMSYSNVSFSVASQDTSPTNLARNNDSSKLYITGDVSNRVIEYSLPTALALGTGSFAAGDVGKTIYANSGSVVLTSTGGAFTIVTALSSTNQVASGSWTMEALVYESTADVIKPSGVSGAGYDISVASYTGDTLSANILQGIRFNNDGTKMFTLQANMGGGFGNVNEYTLSTAYLPSSATYVGGFTVLSQDTVPTDFTFNSDGTKMYMIGLTQVKVFVYNLSTAFSVTSASYANVSANINASGNSPVGMEWSPDGTRLYIANSQYGYIVEHPVSTAFDISTIQVYSNSVGTGTGVTGVAISTDGTKLFNTNAPGANIDAWTLSTPFDLSTNSHTGSFSISAQASTNASGLMFNADGSKMYVCSSVSGIWQYNTQSVITATGYQPAIASTIDSTYWTDLNSLTATNVVGDGNVFYAISNDAKANWSILDNSNGVRKIVKNNSGTYQVNTNTTYGSETWANSAVNTESAALREAMTSASLVSGKYDISNSLGNPVYSQSFSVNAKEQSPKGVAFNSNGTKMFVTGFYQQAVIEYALSTAYDVSTSVYTQKFQVNAQSTLPSGIAFKADGTIMYISEAYNSTVLQYALSTGFDVSTASYTHNFSVASQEANCYGVQINTDGTKMFVTGTSSDAISEYALSTAFDVSSATFTTSFSVAGQEANTQDFVFNPDGTKMWITGNAQVISAYTLTTGFDVSTASFDSINFAVFNQDTQPMGLTWNSDGTKLYFVGDQNNSVYEYTVGTTDYLNQMTGTELNAINDASQITLGSALDFATILYYASGSTIPTYSGTAINYDANVLNNGAVLGTDYNYDAPALNKVRITSVNAANLKIRVV